MEEIYIFVAAIISILVVLLLNLGTNMTIGDVIGDVIPSIRRELDSISDANTTITFPLVWAPESGEFMIQFTMGHNNNRILAVPDTGSEFLIIGGKNCNTCNSSQGIYDESGISTGLTDTKIYGSQTDNISWFIDDMTVDGVTEPLNVEFGTITHATGSSNLNVFGLIGSKSVSDKTPFVNQVMYSQQIIQPSFVFDMSTQTNAKLILGALSDGISGNTSTLLDQTAVTSLVGNDLGIPFYMLRVKGILVDGNAVDAPSVCMLDSGSTNLLCSTKLGASLNNFNSLDIQFDQFSLSYGSEMGKYIEPDSDFDDTSSYNKEVLILGNRFWIGHIFSFDLKNSELTVSTPDPATM